MAILPSLQKEFLSWGSHHCLRYLTSCITARLMPDYVPRWSKPWPAVWQLDHYGLTSRSPDCGWPWLPSSDLIPTWLNFPAWSWAYLITTNFLEDVVSAELSAITTPGLLASHRCYRTQPMLVMPLPLPIMLSHLTPASSSLGSYLPLLTETTFYSRLYTFFWIKTNNKSTYTSSYNIH